MGRRVRSRAAPIAASVLVVLAAGCTRTQPSDAARGDALFAGSCARCHGADGRGGAASAEGPTPRNFRDHEFQASRSDADLKRTIQQGKGTAMPAFGAAFDDAQLAALVAHLRTLDPGPGAPASAPASAGSVPQKGNERR